ncbi:MAG: hypothetical protein KC731_42690, partial [Myxococcales bacterium]|nr:hypothetical protein [Myxococcales bacterium]
PVILLSGHHKQHLVDLARDAGATGVLQKPVRSEELFQAIAEVRGADEGSSDTREVTLPVGLG